MNGSSLTEFFRSDIPKYAILSHRWEAEVTFEDLIDGTSKSTAAYAKIQFCGEQAKRNGLQYLLVDTRRYVYFGPDRLLASGSKYLRDDR